MGFATALSGLKAASTSLQVTGNNIANSQTVGFKESRAEFADVYASSIGGVSKTQPGAGVRVTEVAQQFNQGNIESTQNSLDLAVSGNGFFVLADKVNLPDPNNPNAAVDPSVPSAYTRNGAFQLDNKGNVINSEGKYLLAFAANGTTAAEGFSVGVFRPLTIDTAQGLPNATTKIDMKLNINGAASIPTATVFDPKNPLSYNNTTSITTYDTQGNAHIASTYYVKTPVANAWDAYVFLDGYGISTGGQAVPPVAAPASTVASALNAPGTPIPLTFTASGLLAEVGARAAAVISGGIVTASNTTVTDTAAASTTAATVSAGITAEAAKTAATTAATNATAASAAAAATAGASYTAVGAANALTAALTASTSAAALSTAATTAVAYSSPANLILATASQTAAATAAASAAAYAAAAAGVIGPAPSATGTAAAALAATAAVDAATAQAAANAYNAAVGAPNAAQTALTQAQKASASATALSAAASAVNTTTAAAALATTAKTTAATAAASAAAYATAAAAVVDGPTAAAAAALAVTAAADAVLAQTAANAYNGTVAATAAGATQATKVDFGSIDLGLINPNASVAPMAFNIDFFGSTQFATPFSVNGLKQDGLPAGNLTGIDVDGTGVVFARYSNGGSKALGQVALARFQSNQALAKLGDTTWAQTSNSGQPIYGAAGDNNFGAIQSSALEGSNVDLSAQLVKLIVAQQAYQANSQSITTEKTLLETILRA